MSSTLDMQEQVARHDAILHLAGRPVVKKVVGRFAARHPFLREEFAQEAALAIVEAYLRVYAARCLDGYLAGVAGRACIAVLDLEYRRPRPDRRRRDPCRRPAPRRRPLGGVLRDLVGREPRPDFLAALREELGHEERAQPPPPPAATMGRRLLPGDRAVLRQLLVGEPARSRQEVAAEFERRTGRPLSIDRVSKHRRALGLLDRTRGAAIQKERREAGAYDRWDCRVPRVV